MNENLLMSDQIFEEYPNSYLEVNKDSNYFFISNSEEKFIARQNIDSIEVEEINGKHVVTIKTSYYNVIDDSLICGIVNIYNDSKKSNIKKFDAKIERLHTYLGLNEDETKYLGLDDVKKELNKERVKQKQYKRN